MAGTGGDEGRIIYRCLVCGEEYEKLPEKMVCTCGGPLAVEYREASRTSIRRRLEEGRKAAPHRGLCWLRPFLPVKGEGGCVSLGEGWTHLVSLNRLGEKLGVVVKGKLESQNPTGVFTDRGAAVDAQRAFEKKARRVLVSSLGDHAVSMSSYTARTGARLTAYLPANVEYSKVYRILAGGGRVEIFQDYEAAYEKGLETARRYGYYFSPPMSPFVVEGYRTILLETVIQGFVPDVVVVPIGSGILAFSMVKAGLELEEAGIEAPRVLAVRVREISRSARLLGLSEIAFSPNIQLKVKELIEKKGGRVIEITSDEAVEGLQRLISLEGVSPDIVASVTIAGLEKALGEGIVDRREKILTVFTSGPIKDPVALSIVAASATTASSPRLPHHQQIRLLGETRLAIMRILALLGSSHAYQVWKILREEGYNISLKTVYHHLYVLEKRGLVESHMDATGRRRVYTLTPEGTEILNRLQRR